MLSQLMKKNYIQLDKEASNFKDAIKISVEPLLLDGAITKAYENEILKIYESTGPYIVITKHICLPHAPSENGAKKLAIGFTRLKSPVISGHVSNDPVKYIFPLSAPDNDSHITVLAELAALLSNERFLNLIEEAQSAEEMLSFLEKYEKEM
ncbi:MULTISPECIES: PTS sugar transporter subunit IIA [unclassified Enterococcus]|uniref:PTS sugar transporter subunit IIA n=1 Tax=unclassified Enterococcus TaxID=2608891 RepID=UPI0015565263|nr:MULTISPECIES: PTS sugar transporter subunit IIA [unclassified Enterococcus]MBS7576501.1 PTS sugar transporter subunit IIA [Enterococcus sp. MMGLQ5-2]MBS7585606.1 PTS sugar transporter subunit IIA [Enterococcus sp. MMGLQ5-1]NPD13465.1 PTS sugar transporter subunit IIA [Enterococcus sp. MMGLQ5-1]NPD36338.1 PTS sugar transporter subunit IIA [Enterococcus sp. MMGLQ5-2]